jgi:V/A-type H+-transporting ATPase subunit I
MRAFAAAQTLDLQPIFALQAWAPRERIGEIQEHASRRGMALLQEEPEPGENPPTRLENSPGFNAGEMLVNFYQTPGYWTWDPSSVVLVSFALFFAMILSDGGYAALLGLLTLFLWKRLGKSDGGRRFRNLLAALSVTSLAYGVLVASYFGVSPGKDSFLGKLQVFDVKNYSFMMMLSVVIGVTHLVIANIMESHRRGRTVAALPPLGWAMGILGGFGLWVGSSKGFTALMVFSIAAMAAGMGLVVLYTAAGERPLPRALKGIMGLTGISGAFGDVLSYLRLFALGLASAQLAASFNGMASGIREALPGIGLLFALLVLLIGHGLNLVLSVASGTIHGLRLNVIEFFKWGLKEEGRLFRPFRRKESVPWNR